MPVGLPGHVADVALPFMPEQARELLAEAGYPAGRNLPVITAQAADGEWQRNLAKQLRLQWRENLNIELVIEFTDLVDSNARLGEESADLRLVGYTADYPDPDNFLRVVMRKHVAHWRHKPYHRLIEAARGLMDQKKRVELYRRAELILVQEAPLFPAYYFQWILLAKPWLRHVPFTSHQFFLTKDVVIDPH